MAKKATELPDALKTITCKKKVRRTKDNTVVVEDCGREYLKGTPSSPGVCPNKASHLMSMKTGHCSNGWCEGSKKTDWKGNPVPTCRYIDTCPCKCHTDLAKLFAMTGQERIVVDSSGYAPPHRTYWLPSDDEDMPLDSPTLAPLALSDGNPTPTIEEPSAPVVPPSTASDFAPTVSGRTAKGQLELWVLNQCRIWLIDHPGFPCTPAWVSAHISEDEGVSEPSVGAIDAVFKRWVTIGFAVVEKKPTRFVDFTTEGKRLGLEHLKLRFKKQKKLANQERINNLRRP